MLMQFHNGPDGDRPYDSWLWPFSDEEGVAWWLGNTEDCRLKRRYNMTTTLDGGEDSGWLGHDGEGFGQLEIIATSGEATEDGGRAILVEVRRSPIRWRVTECRSPAQKVVDERLFSLFFQFSTLP
ncbi:Sodium/calcium exchanger protein-domain-containing protein [Sesbania bispinosa]|nr:Sodium/calcium exchanger protein-domain-containing protein [Sesbania bispinosa]